MCHVWHVKTLLCRGSLIQSQAVRPASVSLKATEWNTWFSCTRLTYFKHTIYTHIEFSVSLSEERESHRDGYQSWSSIILLDGLGVTLIQAKWVKFLQGYSRLHAMKQNKKHAHGEQQSPQPPHDLVCTGMERRGLRSRTLREGNKTNLNPSVKCSTNDPPCLPSPCFCNFPLLVSNSNLCFLSDLLSTLVLGLLVYNKGVDSLHSACCWVLKSCCAPCRSLKWTEWERKRRGSRVSRLYVFFFCFFFYNPVTWSLMVSLEISSIKPLFCLPKEFFQTQPPPPPPPQGFTTLHD